MFKKIVVFVSIFFSTSVFAMTLSEVNIASESQLMEIKGIGAKKASLIIKERRQSKFNSMNDLLKIKGIGKKILLNITNNVKRIKKNRHTKKRNTKRRERTKRTKTNYNSKK